MQKRIIFPILVSTAEFCNSYNIYHKTKLTQKLFLAIIMSLHISVSTSV